MFKNALISVSNKQGLIEFIKPLIEKGGLRIVSTGGTSQYLKTAGIPVVDVSEQTKFPEVMGGRVKTLHPHIHMSILARKDHLEDEKLLKENGLEPFDLIIVNLYPFEEALRKELEGQDLIEMIDIGGPSLLRAAAKNLDRISVICDPEDYPWIMEKALKDQKMNDEDRLMLAAKAFSHVSCYDSLIASTLGGEGGKEWSLGGRKSHSLRYGENQEQKALWYQRLGNFDGLDQAEIIQGKPLSYNNILDLDAASGLVSQMEGFACVAVKHNNPCGVAQSQNHELAVSIQKALSSDPISVFGGIVATNVTIDEKCASLLTDLFLECIVAPDFTPEALATFAKKKNLRILKWPQIVSFKRKWEVRTVAGGFLLQETDSISSEPHLWNFLNGQPDSTVLKDLVLAEKVVASLKSNAIAIVSEEQTVGLGMGQVNRVDAVQQAIQRMHTHHPSLLKQKNNFVLNKNLVLASDAFFPFPDSIDMIANAGIQWILQPGGSIKDEEVIAAAKHAGVNMVITHKRHFRH